MQDGVTILSDVERGITASWSGGATAELVDDATGKVIARAAVGEPSRAAEAAIVLERLIADEREHPGAGARRRNLGTPPTFERLS